MKTTLYMVMSLNGFIASKDGNEDFLSDDNWATFKKLAEEFGNIIIGRKTFEVIKSWGEEYSLDKFDSVKKVVVSKHDLETERDYLVAKSAEDALAQLSEAGFEKALLAGGSLLNTSFIKSGLINNLIINVEPCIIGKGISLFAPEDFELGLKLQRTSELESSIVQLSYEVLASRK